MDHMIILGLKDPGHSMLVKWHRPYNKMLRPHPTNIPKLGEQAQGHRGITDFAHPSWHASQPGFPIMWFGEEENLDQH